MTAAFKVFINPDSEEWMVQYPSGKIQFLGLWELLKLAWEVLKRDQTIIIVDKDGTESEA